MKVEKNSWWFIPIERVALIKGTSIDTIRRNLKKNVYSYLKKRFKIKGSGVTKTFILVDEELRRLEQSYIKAHPGGYIKVEQVKMNLEGTMRNCMFCVQYADKPEDK